MDYTVKYDGIGKSERYGHLIPFVNCAIQKGNLNHMEGMAKLANEPEVKISFEMMEAVENYNEEFRPPRKEVAKASLELIQLKKAGYPITNSNS